MSIVNNLQGRLYNSSVFRGLFGDYAKVNNLSILSKDELDSRIKEMAELELAKKALVDKKQVYANGSARYVNSHTNPNTKVDGAVSFGYLRRAADSYPIARACINRRMRQIAKLEWDITTIEEIEDEDAYRNKIMEVKGLMKRPFGNRSRFSQLVNVFVNDILTLDAAVFEIRRRRNGEYLGLIPVDPATILLRVDESGMTPEPPMFAYEQMIDFKTVNSYTTDELLYEKMATRSNSPYGLAPLESLILQVESALRGAMYNLAYFKESNVPEGFITLPEEEALSVDQIKEWQEWFDQIMAGNPTTLRRLKVLPGGSEYIPSKKPEDMSFERFEMWLLQQTCAVFDVQPQDIGITYQVNKATAESQGNISIDKGLLPLASFIKEVFDDVIQQSMGETDLQFIWSNINPTNRREEVELAEKEINMGALSVDEYRIENGREPIGLGHYIKTGSGPLFVDQIGEEQDSAEDEGQVDQEDDTEDGMDEEKMIRTWQRRIFNDLKQKRELKVDFDDNGVIDKNIYKIIQQGLEYVKTHEQARTLFGQFFDKEVRGSVKLLGLDYESIE